MDEGDLPLKIQENLRKNENHYNKDKGLHPIVGGILMGAGVLYVISHPHEVFPSPFPLTECIVLRLIAITIFSVITFFMLRKGCCLILPSVSSFILLSFIITMGIYLNFLSSLLYEILQLKILSNYLFLISYLIILSALPVHIYITKSHTKATWGMSFVNTTSPAILCLFLSYFSAWEYVDPFLNSTGFLFWTFIVIIVFNCFLLILEYGRKQKRCT